MDTVVLGDVELALLGMLPRGHRLAGPLSPEARPGGVGAPVALAIDSELQQPGHVGPLAVALLDHESTPLATLTGALTTTTDGLVLVGSLTPGRTRESGEGRRYTLTAADASRGWQQVVVLGRPPVEIDRQRLAGVGGPTLVVVPDDPAATDGVPTGVVIDMAERLAAHLPEAQVRVAPLRWRDASSDQALVGLLAGWVGASSWQLLHPDPTADPHAGQWLTARRELDSATEQAPLEALDPRDAHDLRRWRPSRGHRGLVVMFTGLSGSGKSTIARALKGHIERATPRTVTLLDGDVVRQLLSAGLGFDRASRDLNVRRIGYVAAEVARHGGIAICAPVAPYAATRADVRRMASEVGDFVLVHVSTPLAECERRDLKGLYAKARAGLVPEFTGISDPYEEPLDADLTVDTSTTSIEQSLAVVVEHLRSGGWLPADDPDTPTTPRPGAATPTL